jgi:hypothetical protein
MEIDVGNYGRMIFELVLSNNKYCPEHWKSIIDKAEPLVKELLALNDEMKVDGHESKYTIVGQIGEKYFMTKSEKIETAMQKTLEISVEQLKEGDFVFNTFLPNHSLIEAVYNSELAHVVEITKKGRWVAYYTTRDYVGKKPWCNPNWSIMNFDLLTEEEAIKACLYHLEYNMQPSDPF